jgi:hypothetical protein
MPSLGMFFHLVCMCVSKGAHIDARAHTRARKGDLNCQNQTAYTYIHAYIHIIYIYI